MQDRIQHGAAASKLALGAARNTTPGFDLSKSPSATDLKPPLANIRRQVY